MFAPGRDENFWTRVRDVLTRGVVAVFVGDVCPISCGPARGARAPVLASPGGDWLLFRRGSASWVPPRAFKFRSGVSPSDFMMMNIRLQWVDARKTRERYAPRATIIFLIMIIEFIKGWQAGQSAKTVFGFPDCPKG